MFLIKVILLKILGLERAHEDNSKRKICGLKNIKGKCNLMAALYVFYGSELARRRSCRKVPDGVWKLLKKLPQGGVGRGAWAPGRGRKAGSMEQTVVRGRNSASATGASDVWTASCGADVLALTPIQMAPAITTAATMTIAARISCPFGRGIRSRGFGFGSSPYAKSVASSFFEASGSAVMWA